MSELEILLNRLPYKKGNNTFNGIYKDEIGEWHISYKNKYGAISKSVCSESLKDAVIEIIEWIESIN